MRPLSVVAFASLSVLSASMVTGLFAPSAGSRSADIDPPHDPAAIMRAVLPSADGPAEPPANKPGRDRDDVEAPPAVVSAQPDAPAALPTGAAAPEGSGCPAGMVLVEGKYCPNVKQECVKYMEDPIKFPRARCAEFAATSECLSEKVPLRFCIDKLEARESAPAAEGKGDLPAGDVSWTQAKNACEAQGKRLCEEREWTLACEGDAMQPYPYGFVRDSTACNFDQTEGLVTQKGALADLRQPVDANPRCESPYGVRNMVGNIDEWIVLDKPHYSDKNNGRKMLSGLKGGWWGPMRNRCRPTTVDHDEVFHELQTGYRCCAGT
jgi:formylglycine-generating enzyme